MDDPCRRVAHPTATLTLFCGLPGSGKSTLAKRLEAEGRGVRLCTDDWQASLDVSHADIGFHDRLQRMLFRHALLLLEHGVDVVLEDGLWTRGERAEKFSAARACGARIEWHIFDVPYATLWARLQERNNLPASTAYPMTELELRSAASLFRAPSAEELASVDSYAVHGGGFDDLDQWPAGDSPFP